MFVFSFSLSWAFLFVTDPHINLQKVVLVYSNKPKELFHDSNSV